jgi:exosortase
VSTLWQVFPERSSLDQASLRHASRFGRVFQFALAARAGPDEFRKAMPAANANSTLPSSPSSKDVGQWLPWLPLVGMVGWWLNDLRFQWASQIEYRFGWIVAMLTVYLAWERWEKRPREDRPAPLWQPVVLALVGTPLVAIAELYKLGVARTPASSMLLSLGCASFVAAGILTLRGPKTLWHFLFPFGFFFIAVPMPKLVWDPIVFGLRDFVTMLNIETLNLIGIPAHRQGYIIVTPRCEVGVDEACSGVRSLQSSIMAALFVGDLSLRHPAWKGVFLFAGVGLAVIGNFLRSLFLSLTAHYNGVEALQKAHDAAGWTVLAFTAVGVSLLAWLLIRFERQVLARVAADSNPNPPV